ncbi:hypothetical protein JK358_38435 [Nocardia sp. 2]|uniref:Uncharacterized protein n=1 Tax=Nocardia acididurans TaxID=2802282 RepID=A0ABS1MJS0_9NOCA|nr:hypothetical protein [Nocardia acididurans]MBL1080290.1 hypothetical protein [Nocardia acididurans]
MIDGLVPAGTLPLGTAHGSGWKDGLTVPIDRAYVQRIEQRIVERAIEGLRFEGMAPRPQLHFILEDRPEPHAGYVMSRFYHRGADAHAAIAGLGRAAAAICSTQLVLMWEECDLRASLFGAGDHPDGIVTVDATFDDHILTWRPYEVVFGPIGFRGVPTVQPRWGDVLQLPGAPLPGPILDLLAAWRTQLTTLDPAVELPAMQRSGYEFRWYVYDEEGP